MGTGEGKDDREDFRGDQGQWEAGEITQSLDCHDQTWDWTTLAQGKVDHRQVRDSRRPGQSGG